jgi:hypothetical protein
MIHEYVKSKGARIFFLLLALNVSTASMASAQTAVEPLLFINSPRAVAMGGCSADFVGAESPLYDPAGLGLFHLDHVLSLQLPNSTKWLPEVTSDLRLRSWGLSAGISYKIVKQSDSLPFNIAVGVAYSRLKMDYGEFIITNVNGDPLSSVKPYDKTDNFSAGIGLELYRVLRVGAGYTYKRVNSKLAQQGAGVERSSATASGNAHDFGVIAQARLLTLVPHRLYFGDSKQYYAHMELTPSYAYVKANIGDSLVYNDASQPDALPKVSREGPSIYASLDINQSTLASFRWTKETESELADDSTVANKHGYELGALGVFYYRSGKLQHFMGGSDFDTHGFGLSLSGLVSWLTTLGTLDTGKSMVYSLLSDVDITFDYAVWHSKNNALDNTKFYKLTVAITK